MTEQRKLAAIMFTDIVGYTALMSKDEQKAHQIIQKSRDFLKALIEKYNGECLQTVGDETLSSFSSVVDAVNCALEIQLTLRDDPALSLRIGIHIGDVVFEGDEIYGDGVNVASRLQPLADPGSICVSGQVYRNIRNRPGIEAVFLGEKTLKNVDLPLKIYTITPEELPAAAAKPYPAERPSAKKPKPSIAVLPFIDMSPDKDQEYFCDGMSEEIINALTHVEGLHVVARTSAFVFKDKREDIREIGRKLNVDSLLEGSVRKAGNRLRISAQLINIADGYHLWSERYDREMKDIFDIQDEISLAIVDKLKVKLLGKEKEAIEKSHTEDYEAYELYLKGNYFWNTRSEAGYQKGIDCFQKAIEKDSHYALAYSGVAKCCVALGLYFTEPKAAFQKAKEATEKALEIDDMLGEAHALLGVISAFFCDWHDAEKEIKRAIDLNPNNVYAHHAYASILPAIGRHDEAVAEAQRALELEPLSRNMNSVVGFVLQFARRYDEAIEQFRKTLEIDPDFQHSLMYLGITYMAKEMYEESIETFQKLVPLSGDSPISVGLLGYAYALAGRVDEAIRMQGRLGEISEKRYVSPFHKALIYMGLGETDKAFEFLDDAYGQREFLLIYLKEWSVFDPIRSDPRFKILLKKMNLDN